MARKIFSIIFIILYLAIIINAEDKKSPENTIKQQRTEVIQYGIDSEIIELIKTLKKDNNSDFNKNLFTLLKSTQNVNLKSKIVDLYSQEKDPIAVNFVFSEIKDNYDLPNEILTKFISYISDFQNPDITKYFKTLIFHQDQSISNAAIDAIGISKDDKYGKTLLDLLDNSSTPDTQKIHLIGALGNLKYTKAVDSISKILKKDYTDNRSLKWKACIALGKIGSKKSLPVLTSLFSDSDPYLRNYAIEALQHFPSEQTEDLIIQGLRDSSWRVRVSSAKSLGKLKSLKAVPILIYKVKKDPDIKNVRNAAIEALGEIKGIKALSFLRKMLLDDKANGINRTSDVSVLIKNDLSGSLPALKELIDNEWEKPSSPLLDYTCKLLSKEKNAKLKVIYLKMLDYTKTLNLKIYGLRGIKLNNFSSLKEKVKNFTTKKYPEQIKKIAQDTLDSLK